MLACYILALTVSRGPHMLKCIYVLRYICRTYRTQTNVLMHKYCKCSALVKITLFNLYCINVYDFALSSQFCVGAMTHLQCCLFHHDRRYTVIL